MMRRILIDYAKTKHRVRRGGMKKEQAFEYLEKSYQRRELWICYLQVDPRFDSLRDDPRFDELVKRVGLK